MLLLEVGTDLLVVALELLVHVDEALRDGNVAVLAPGDWLMVSDEVMGAAEDVVVPFFIHFVARAGLALRLRKLPHAISCLEDMVLSLDGTALSLDVEVAKVRLTTVGFHHVLFVRLTIFELKSGTNLAFVATALLSLSIKTLKGPVLKPPVKLFFLLLRLGSKLFVLLNDLVKE